jgi:hypothetical protein
MLNAGCPVQEKYYSYTNGKPEDGNNLRYALKLQDFLLNKNNMHAAC